MRKGKARDMSDKGGPEAPGKAGDELAEELAADRAAERKLAQEGAKITEDDRPDPLKATVSNDPNLWEHIVGRLSQNPQGPRAAIPRRTMTFIIDGATTAVFEDDEGNPLDFYVTMRSLTSSEEIQALKGMTAAPDMPALLAKASLYACNGTPIPVDQKDLFWEALGNARQILTMAFSAIGSASNVALGKYQRSISVG